MKCPWCSKPLNGAHSTCPGCGHAFSNVLSEKIFTILRLKDNLAELQAIARRTSDSASSLTSQIAELEQQAANEARLEPEPVMAARALSVYYSNMWFADLRLFGDR